MARRFGGPARRFVVKAGCVLGAAWLFSCGAGSSAVFPTASQLPDDDRRPDGIAVDRISRPPPTQDRASAEAGVVALRAPLGIDVAHRTVRRFFEAVADEDMSAMSDTIRSGTMVQDIRPARRGQAVSRELRPVLSWWRERFRKYEYEDLAGRLLYRDADIETYRADQVDSLPLNLRYAVQHQPEPFEGPDLVLRVPIITHTVHGERLLGDEMSFWLRRQKDEYIIYHMAEPLHPLRADRFRGRRRS